MNAEIICVTHNTAEQTESENINITALSLASYGVVTKLKTYVNDSGSAIQNAIASAVKRSDVVVFISSLDAKKRKQISNAVSLPLTVNEDSKKRAEAYFNNFTNNNELSELYVFPKGSTVIPNDYSICDGFICKVSNAYFIALPDSTVTVGNMLNTYVKQFFAETFKQPVYFASLNAFNITKEEAENKLSSLIKCRNPKITVNKAGFGICINIQADATDLSGAAEVGKKAVKTVSDILGDCVYSQNSETLAEVTVNRLINTKTTVSCAESCTGGMIAETITGISGASNIIEMGICAYSDRIKREALGVPKNTLESFGAVSAEAAGYMAIGIKNISGSALGVAVTGVAGPSKSEGKAVGTVYVSLTDGKKTWIVNLNLSSHLSRDEIRKAATLSALEMIRKYTLYGDDLNHSCPANGPYKSYLTLPRKISAAYLDDDLPDLVVSYEEPQNTQKTVAEIQPNTVEFQTEVEEETYTPETPITVESDFVNLYDIGDTEELPAKDISGKNENAFKRFMHFAFPNKNSSAKENVIKSVFLFVAVVIIASAVFMVSYFSAISHQKHLLSEAQNVFSTQSTEDSYNTLLSINGDYKCWLNAGKINAPVYQYTDNEYYLERNMNKEKSRYGALFFDYRDIVNENSMSLNCTVYGKNINDGSLFGSLSDYKELNYFKENRKISLTFGNGKRDYEIFSVCIVNSLPEDDNGKMFNFVRSNFSSTDEFNLWIAEAKLRSIYLTDCNVTSNDKVLTLVTTTDEFENARLVIMAKLLNDGENLSNYTALKVNPSPLYPQAWYDAYGLSGYSVQNNETSSTESETESETTSSEETSSAVSSSTQSTTSTPKPKKQTTQSSSTSSTVSEQPIPSEPTASGEEQTSSEPSGSSEPTEEQNSSEVSSEPQEESTATESQTDESTTAE